MSGQPPDPRGAADEQRTTALPRPRPDNPAADRAAGPVGTGTGRRPGAPETQETTILRRPSQQPPASNLPGAGRAEPPRRPGSHLPPYQAPALPPRLAGGPHAPDDPYRRAAAGSATGAPPPPPEGPHAPDPRRRGLKRQPRKLTVTRVAALRSAELTHLGLEKFHGAVSADGAGRSGLSQLTYAVMGNYAVDAALAVALANTLFFAAAKAESTGKVLLYLLLTVAPFAIIAPLIGPALDKLQRGRRFALAASSLGRAALAVVMALNFDSWIIYPCALGMLVLSKGFGVLKAALTPRVLPEAITLVKTNSRLAVFGLIAGGASGGIAAGIAAVTTSAGALWFTAVCGIVGAWLCLRIPAWVESTEGEVPIRHTGTVPRPADPTATASAASRGAAAGRTAADRRQARAARKAERPALPRVVVQTLWANSTIRIETGFLALFIAFVIKTRYQTVPVTPTPGVALGAGSDDQGWMQLLLLGAVGAAAGVGGFLGNALGARLPLKAPGVVALWCLGAVIASVVVAFIFPGLVTAGVVALVGSTASSLAKVCLDATIQFELPEASRASAFGRSESVLQLSWVFGGVVGLLIGGIWALGGNAVYLVGFGIVAVFLIAGFAQCVAIGQGRTLLPTRGRRQPRGSRRRPATPVSTPGQVPVPTPGQAPATRTNGAPPVPPPPASWSGPGADTQGAPAPVRRTRKAGRPR